MSSGILYGASLSQPTRSCLLLMNECGLDIEYKQVNILSGDHKKEPFTAINPVGLIPAYQEGDFNLSEGAAILAYLCNSRNLNEWYPSDPKVRAKVDQWMHWNHRATRNGTVNVMAPSLFGGDVNTAEFEKHLPLLEAHFSKNKFLVTSDHPTIADLFILPELDQLGLDCASLVDFAPYSHILRYISDMKAALPKSYDKNFGDAVAAKNYVVEALKHMNDKKE